MKVWVILTAMVLVLTVAGCAQKSSYTPPLSEDEKIMRAILKLKPQDIIRIPPSEEKIGEYNLSLYQKTGTLSCYEDGKTIVTVHVFGDIGNSEGYFLTETKDSKIAYIRIDWDEEYFLKINSGWQQISQNEAVEKFEWLHDFINKCKREMGIGKFY